MRAHSARAALRALRSAASAPVASVRVAPARAFCVHVPPAVKDAAVESPVVVHSAQDPPAAAAEDSRLAVDAVPVASVLEAAPEPDASEGAQPEVGEELIGADALGGAEDLDVALSDSTEHSAGSSETTPQRARRYVRDFSTPAELTEHLQMLIGNKGTRSAMWLFRYALEQEGSPLISVESIRLMLPIMARNGWFVTSQDALLAAESHGFQLSTALYNCALFSMTRMGNIPLLEETLARMSSGRALPNATSYNLLIAAHFYAGTTDDAFGVLQAMKTANIYPTIATYQTLVSGCLRRRDHRRAYHTLNAIEQQGMTVSAMTVAQVLFAVANDDSYDHVAHLLGKLEETLPAYAADVDRISAKRSMYNGKHVKTSVHHRESVRGTPRLELSALDALMHSAARGARPDIAVRAWNILSDAYPEYPHTPDHWYSLIGALAASGDFSAAFDAVGYMRAAGLVPRIRDLTVALIRPLSSDVEKIDEQYYRLVERLEAKDSAAPAAAAEPGAGAAVDVEPVAEETVTSEAQEEPDAVIADAAHPEAVDAKLDEDIAKDLSSSEDLDALEAAENAKDSAEEIDAPLSLSDILRSPESAPDSGLEISSYELPWADHPRAAVGMTELNCVIAACALAGDLDRAFQTYDEACGRLGLQRDGDTLNALLEGCVQTRHLRGGARILEEARKDGLAHHPDTLNLGARLLLRGQRSADALAMLRDAREADAYVAARTFQMVARQLARSGDMVAAEECVELAAQAGYRRSAIAPRDDAFRSRGRFYGGYDAGHAHAGERAGARDAAAAEPPVDGKGGGDGKGSKVENHST